MNNKTERDILSEKIYLQYLNTSEATNYDFLALCSLNAAQALINAKREYMTDDEKEEVERFMISIGIIKKEEEN